MQNFKQGKHNSIITSFPRETEGDCIDNDIAIFVQNYPDTRYIRLQYIPHHQMREERMAVLTGDYYTVDYD